MFIRHISHGFDYGHFSIKTKPTQNQVTPCAFSKRENGCQWPRGAVAYRQIVLKIVIWKTRQFHRQSDGFGFRPKLFCMRKYLAVTRSGCFNACIFAVRRDI